MDIPAAISQLQTQFPQLTIKLLPYLGADNRLAPFLAQQFAPYPHSQRILLAHGSRRTGANPTIDQLAQTLHAQTAYWATEPSLQDTIQTIASTAHSVYILPYFLFSGRIPAAIADQLPALQSQYPHLQLQLGKPFGTELPCAQAITQLLT